MSEPSKLLTYDEMECLERASIQIGHFKGMIEERINRAPDAKVETALKDVRLLADQLSDSIYRLRLKEYMRG